METRGIVGINWHYHQSQSSMFISKHQKSYAHEPQMKNGEVLGRDKCLFRWQLKFLFINLHLPPDQGHRGGFGEMESSKRSWSETGLP